MEVFQQILLISLSSVAFSFGDANKLMLPEKGSSQVLPKAVAHLIVNTWNVQCTTINLIHDVGVEKQWHLHDFVKQLKTFTDTMGTVIFRVESKDSFKYPIKRRRKCQLFLVESYTNLVEVFRISNPPAFQYDGLYLVVMVGNQTKDVEDMFKLLWKHQVSNAVVAYESQSKTVLFDTFKPFNPSKCGDTRPITVNEYENGRFLNAPASLYPNKLKNLHECTMRVATSNGSVPYIFTELLSNGSFRLWGRDILILDAIAKSLNFKIDYVYVGDEGFLLENGTAGGPLLLLLENRVDLIIADYWLKVNRLKFIDFSTPYINQHIAFVIPPGAELTSFEKFIKPLDFETWMYMMCIFVFCFFVIYVVGKTNPQCKDFIFGKGIRKPYMNILVAIFGGSQHILPRHNFARTLLMMFLMFCLVMRTLYTGSLYTFLRANIHHQEAQSIDDMIQFDYKFYVVPSILDLVEGQSRISQRLVEQEKLRSFDYC